MEEIYRLGKHEFATREEWEAAKRDLDKIEKIVGHLDIDDPEIAEDLYHLVREGKLTFESKLGTIFFCDMSDRVAQNFEHKLKRSRILRQKKLQKDEDSWDCLRGIIAFVYFVLRLFRIPGTQGGKKVGGGAAAEKYHAGA